jgi:spermidine synthase
MPGRAPLGGILALIGFTSVIAQVVLMRELMVAFYGNEISLGLMLACWLLWTAVGSGVLGRSGAKRSARHQVAALEAITALAFPLAIAAVRASRPFLQHASGELLGFGPMFLTALVALGLFCPFSGWLFAAGSRLLALERGISTASATSSVYVLEAAGSALGGLLASLALVRWLPPFGIAALLAVLNLLAAVMLLGRRAGAPALILAALLVLAMRPAETFTLDHFWSGFRLLSVRNSVYGNLAVLETDGSRSLAENGLVVSTVPDPAAAEEAVHFALLEHPRPQDVLVIGGCANGSLAEALKHPSVELLDCVELDPAIPQLARQFFPGAIPMDPRVRVHAVDGVRFLKSGAVRFDVILVSLPEPQTAQLNRYYTAEFFASAARRLRPGGLLALAFPSSENYLSPESQALLRCMDKTLATAFPHIAALPGETVHLFGGFGPLITNAQQLIERLHARHLETLYVSEYFLPFRLAPERVRELAQQIQPGQATPVNHDFTPIAYYFDLTRWSARFGGIYRALLEHAGQVPFRAVAAAALAALAGLALVVRPTAGALCVGTSGFTMIGVEIMLLLGFQAVYGYVYQQMALLVAAFMAGMSLGGWMALRRSAPPSLAPIQLAIAASPLAAFSVLSWGAAAPPAAALGCGALGGFQFAAASRQYFTHSKSRAGKLYAVDLAGSCTGALLLSAYLIPVFGFLKTSEVMALVSLVAAIVAFADRRRPAR